jgi:hypothetical protein
MISNPDEEESNLVHSSEPVSTNVTVIDQNTGKINCMHFWQSLMHIVLHLGIGMWQTVTTREVDEEKETEDFEEARKAMVDEMNKAPQVLCE